MTDLQLLQRRAKISKIILQIHGSGAAVMNGLQTQFKQQIMLLVDFRQQIQDRLRKAVRSRGNSQSDDARQR